DCDRVESRPSRTANFAERVAVVALLRLEDQRSLDLKRCASAHEFHGDRSAGPSVHDWTPRRVACQIGERAERHCNQENRQHRNWPPLPAFFPLTRKEWERQQDE